MSQRNNQDAKQSAKQNARERMRAERERQQRAATVRRKITIGAISLAVVVVAAGVSVALAGNGGSSGPLVLPANSSGTDGTVIVYGNPASKNVLDVYEDLRCPICDELEKTDGTTIQQLADNGTYVIHYHMATFLDSRLGGSGSHNALAAAGAALNESPAMFKKFHDVLYANQPAEENDGFASTSHLLALAAQVPGLVTPDFTKAVKDGTYKPWVDKVTDAFNNSGVSGTPTLKLNGKQLTVFDGQGTPISSTQYTQLIQQTVSAN
ncbi:DsbA family protein [Kitasatospora viridis]|uniref:Protein-disulfide isomerase n=1 Tax=Kitasatospora viridis TaxID=281105 RepID=A0A561TV92_9ACTN|nr:thioredoxin domain-containing protein [Kitasatospora viridis]TWF91030.1 protein-disulfide isomerase [Kitasatospora viridis]